MELTAPSRWSSIDFISDLHLSPLEESTFQVWRNYLNSTPADAVFILGDLFEVWVGDDVLTQKDSFERRCADLLQHIGHRTEVYLMCGNRDFLMGEGLLHASHTKWLPDPTVLLFGNQRILLTHGDALCLDDTDYQTFRETVRTAVWRNAFLRKPLEERLSFARGLREQSELRKKSGIHYPDVDDGAACALMFQCNADLMIHGHTHRPAMHTLSNGKPRWVLSDWHVNAREPRADVITCTLRDQSVSVARQQLVPI